MKRTKTIIAAVLISGLSAFAAEPLSSSTHAGTELKTVEQAGFQKKQHKNILKLSKPSFLSGSSAGILNGDINGGGLFLNVGIFLPSSKYLNPDFTSGDKKLYKLGFDAEFGHYFKLLKVSKFSLGIRLTWLSASYTSYSDLVAVHAISVSPIRVGPQGVVALNDKMAVNFFYQIGANYTIQFESYGGSRSQQSFLGATHEIGAGFQYRVFNLGIGYRFGTLKNIGNSDSVPKDSRGFATNNLRIYLGLKF
jgi:hypothetical protein